MDDLADLEFFQIIVEGDLRKLVYYNTSPIVFHPSLHHSASFLLFDRFNHRLTLTAEAP
jgi:hypothetical protein